MKKWAIVPVMGALWLVGLTYASGIGLAYDVYGKTKLATIGIFLFMFIFRGKFHRISLKMLGVLAIMVVGCTMTYIRFDRNVEDYLWVYLLIPLIALLPVEKAQMRLVALMYGALGGAVLFLANYGSVFRGWNPNSVGMIAFFSYMVFVSSFSEVRNKRAIFALVVYSLIYFSWLEILNARSSALFSIAAFLCVFSIIPLRSIVRVKQFLPLVLLAPLLLAVVVVLIRDTPIDTALNLWSWEHFNKPIFNGRENIWAWGFRDWWKAPIFGSGTLNGSFHNSAVTMLYGCGAAGFVVWVSGTRNMLRRGLAHLDDSVIYGLLIAFLMIWLQQSLELGMVAPQANVVPYGILGLLLGRVKTLENNDGEESIDHHPGI